MQGEKPFFVFSCESPDLNKMNEHNYWRDNQTENVSENGRNHEEYNENIRRKYPKTPLTADHLLFTCLKPLCDVIFQSFVNFKTHYRKHFGFEDELMCWQCCLPFSNASALKIHQLQGNCRTDSMFKCYRCFETFNDLQSLSIHKYTVHNGDLILVRRRIKTILCAYCRDGINIYSYKNHLIHCKKRPPRKDMRIKRLCDTTRLRRV